MSSDLTQDFDGPVIEPIRGIGDVKFKRADWAFWSGWATALKAKRVTDKLAEIEKAPLNTQAKIEARTAAKNLAVYLDEVFSLRHTSEGADKIMRDAYMGGGGEKDKWDDINRRIGPARRLMLIEEICSEPRPTVDELRSALRELAKKAHKQPPPGLDNMNDEELIAVAREYQPEKEKDTEADPLAESPSSESSTT
jgi:hypothetical protein